MHIMQAIPSSYILYTVTHTHTYTHMHAQIKTIAKWTFNDPNDKMIGCFEVPLQVTN